VPIGYIPAGSTNDFAASLHLPTNPVKAAQAIVEGQPMTYDVGRFGQRYFAYVASFGAFTRASYATPQSIKNALGHTAYILEGITELPQIHKTHVRLELDGGRVVEDDFIFGAISNSTSVGGVLTLDPKQVDMRDGLFELLLVRAPRDLAELGECIKALRTHQYNCRMITFLSASSVAVTADPHMCWTLDGEKEEGHHRVQVENLRHAIRLIQRTES
jgi:YegS/Rv2252/BmrU family lipid kinase